MQTTIRTATGREVRREVARYLFAPNPLRLSVWADRHYRLSAVSSAETGKWTTLPYQVEIMDCMTDQVTERVTVMKGSRIGLTKTINCAVGYYIEHDPASVIVVQPTVEDAKDYGKEEIDPMLEEVACLRGLVTTSSRGKDKDNTLRSKKFPGGKLLLKGANAGTGFRRTSARILMFDEVDAYPPSAGNEGDPIKLGEKRTQHFWNRKIVAVSSPTLDGASRIAQLYEQGDMRTYQVPCPHCGTCDELVFQREEEGRGHVMSWPDGQPEQAHFVCSSCEGKIEQKHHSEMVAAGFWQAAKPFSKHASFYIWAAYSYAANASWAQLAQEYVEAIDAGEETLQVFWNTIVGKPYRQKGEAPEWKRLYDRREHYPFSIVPAGVRLVTCGVDVQGNRLVYEVVGWGARKENWSIEAGVLMGDTSSELNPVWEDLDALLFRTWPGEDDSRFTIERMAVDSGYNTQVVYAWTRKHPRLVMAIKGKDEASAILGAPRDTDVKKNGVRVGTCSLWIVGSSIAKQQIYGWLRAESKVENGEEIVPAGWSHFPMHAEDYFKQLTAEQVVVVRKKSGHFARVWTLLPGRENHFLDARVYATAAAAPIEFERRLRGDVTRRRRIAPPPRAAQAAPSPAQAASPAPPAKRRPRPNWLDEVRGLGSRRGGWR